MNYAAIAVLCLVACAAPAGPVAHAETPAAAPAQAASGPAPPAALPRGGDSASLSPADAPAGAYHIDPPHSKVFWSLRHMGMGLFTARFDTVSGTLNWNPQHPENSTITATIAANSIDTGVLDEHGQRAFDAEIANLALGAEQNPNITFVSRAIRLTGPTSGLITGDLTLHGQTHPVTLEAQFEGSRYVLLIGKQKIAFSARTIIDRSQWGASFANPIRNSAPGNEVEIRIQAEFIKD
jgi:polyisoprenoid-binding protein YceI